MKNKIKIIKHLFVLSGIFFFGVMHPSLNKSATKWFFAGVTSAVVSSAVLYNVSKQKPEIAYCPDNSFIICRDKVLKKSENCIQSYKR